jgi:hypothetical protein
VPSDRKAIENLFSNFPRSLENSQLIDLGSGDGRIVHAAARRGICATGVELNPWLVLLARYRAYRENLSCKFVQGNIHSKFPSLFDPIEKKPLVFVLYGVPSVVGAVGELVDRGVPSDRRVLLVSNALRVPGWGMREIGLVDTFWIYERPPK